MHQPHAIRLIALLVLIPALVAPWWLASTADSDDTSWARISRDGTLRVGTALEAPYVYLDDAGRLTGLEVETVEHIAAELGITRIDWQQTAFDSLIPDLLAGRFDMIAAGLFVTPQRAALLAFSEPTFHVGPTLLVGIGNPHRLNSYADLAAQAELKVAVLHGAVEAELLRACGVADRQIIVVPDALTGRVAVETGLTAALALSQPSVNRMVADQRLGKLEIAAPFQAPRHNGLGYIGFGAMAFRPGDRELLARWNRQLAGFVGGAAHRELLIAFGFGADALPGSTTTAEILGRMAR
ncbi:transporter substrate-binding domain-containing protein [Methylomonas sp. UP202]|uniref:transporter substrate-binding domain-containing protein n=1 Tax=Methylomonas sp. UP202 TaxID=3040943 RepID=UPI002478367E|nr:transporter substrate-binding domain-containing protein [Methylomonas sp. UP202]WGS87336.1 transporter substrate-binding domain-containing protein [Methylomonas sp. UP202]